MNYMIPTFNLTESHTSDSLFKMYFVPQNRIQENRHWKTNKSIMKRFQLEGQSLQIRADRDSTNKVSLRPSKQTLRG